MTTSTISTVDVGDVEIHVERRGAGPDVLLIAGLGDPVESWQAQLDGLSDRYRLTAYDNRGMDRTPLGDRPLSFADMADDAAAVLDVPRAHVLAFSGGAAIVQQLALRHPERVRSLVLVGTWARSDAYSRAALRAWRWQMDP